MSTNEEKGATRRRPIGVWLVSGIFTVSAVYTLTAVGLVGTGIVALPSEYQSQLASFTAVDWIFSVITPLVTLCAAVCLFMLRRVAASLFLWRFALNLAAAVYMSVFSQMSDSMLGNVFQSVILSACMAYYARTLVKSGVLA